MIITCGQKKEKEQKKKEKKEQPTTKKMNEAREVMIEARRERGWCGTERGGGKMKGKRGGVGEKTTPNCRQRLLLQSNTCGTPAKTY